LVTDLFGATMAGPRTNVAIKHGADLPAEHGCCTCAEVRFRLLLTH
jgi:hypothetical protein